jgi:uncharacterized protein (DUF362 family)
MPDRSLVAVVSVGDSVQEAVREAMERAYWKQYLQPSRPTSLKVNLGWDLFIPGSITSPWVMEGVILAIRDYVGPLYLVESDQVLENVEKAFQKSRLQELLDRYGVKWINMTKGAVDLVDVPGGQVFQRLEVPRILRETQFITVPVMKTHAKTQITGAIKNQWGCIGVLRHKHHLVLKEALADINSVIRPAFAVLDATIALEGNGPKSGSPRVVNRILASHDIVALDTVQAKIMGLDPSQIDHVRNCGDRCLGKNHLEDIEIVGESGAETLNLLFRPARHNLVSRVEEICRRSKLKWLVFETPLFLLMLLGAKIWYYLWFYLGSGKRHWNNILQDPKYGPEWSWVKGIKL